MKSYILNQQQLADLLGISSSRLTAVAKEGRIVRSSEGMYDLHHPTNREYIAEYFHREYLKNFQPDEQDNSLTTQLLRERVEYTQARKQKIMIQTAMTMRKLVPTELVDYGWATFAGHISNNLLTLGEKVARGDVALRDRIEKITKAALERTIEASRRDIAAYAETNLNEIYIPDEDLPIDDIDEEPKPKPKRKTK